jgi:hypothetical protein
VDGSEIVAGQSVISGGYGVGEMTVERFETEKGQVSGTVASLQRIRTALEKAGVEFIDATQDKGAGVRLAHPLEPE